MMRRRGITTIGCGVSTTRSSLQPPGIAHYGIWKVIGGTNRLAPNTHFHFVGIDGPESLGQVWNDSELNQFRQERRRRSGIADANPAAKTHSKSNALTPPPGAAWPGAGSPTDCRRSAAAGERRSRPPADGQVDATNGGNASDTGRSVATHR